MLGRAIGIVAASVLMASCASSGGPEFTRADGEAVRAIGDQYAAAFNAQDVEALQALFSGNVAFMPPNSSTVRGPESAGGYYTTLFAGGESELEVGTGEIGGEGTLAFAQGTYRLITRTPVAVADDDEGEEEDADAEGGDEDSGEVEMVESRDRGKWLLVLRKPMAGEWLIEQLMWSSDLPVPAAPVPSSEG